MNATLKRRLTIVGLALALAALLVNGLAWIDGEVRRQEEKARTQEAILREVTTLAARVRAESPGGKPVRPAALGGEEVPSLLPWLEKESAAFQLTDKMQQIAPIPVKGNEGGFREKADLTLKAIPMETALRFLQRLEAVPRLRIVRGEIKRTEKDGVGISLALEIGLL
ncbi:MAG: hypothetical protein HQL96_08420 [Magnetococcales bacterium]|nr:hypothetical protein [Magnetococcales bacterium]